MRKHYSTFLIIAVLATVCLGAIEGTALIAGDGVIARVDAATGVSTTIVDRDQFGTSWKDAGSFTGPCFSPDGKRVAFLGHDWYGPETTRRWLVYIADNDGLHRDSICETEANTMQMPACMSWTTTGYLYWSEDNDRIYRASLTGKQREVVASIADFTGELPTRINNLKVSLDGTRGGSMKNGSSEGAFGYDFTQMIAKSFGGGCQGTVSPNGQLVTHSTTGALGYSFHQVAFIHDFDTKDAVDTIFAPGAVPGGGTELPRLVFLRFSHSSNDHVVFSGEDALSGLGFVHCLSSNETTELGTCKPYDFWSGTLPPPPTAGPIVALDSSSLTFASLDGAVPAAKVVNVSNTGEGTLGTVSVQGEPAWLTVTLGGSGNAQTLTNSVSVAGLQPGVYNATITVTATDARSANYAVTLNVARTLLAPSGFTATARSSASAQLNWTDNADNESGFSVERMTATQAWQQVASLPANTTSHVDTPLAPVTMYHYRVRAFNATDSSAYSNEDSLSLALVRTITLQSPQAGASWSVGSTVHIQWTTENVALVDIYYSFDGGETLLLIPQQSVPDTSQLWGNYPWVVPQLPSDSVMIVVQEYSNPSVVARSPNVYVMSTGTLGPAPNAAGVLRTGVQCVAILPNRAVCFACHVGPGASPTLSVQTIKGRQVWSARLAATPGIQRAVWNGDAGQGQAAAPGIYVAHMSSGTSAPACGVPFVVR
jgi:hypothetical protein